MHILIIPSWYKTPQQPVSGTFFEEHARMLVNKGFKVGVLYPSLHSRYNFKAALRQFVHKDQPEDLVDKGIPTLYSFSNSIVPSRFQQVNNWFVCYAAYRKYKKYVSQYGQPDIIHAQSVFVGGWVARYISRKENIPYIFTEHTSSILHSKWITSDKVTKGIVKKTFSDAKRSVFVSNSFRQNLISKYDLPSINAVTIPNVVNPLFYSTALKKEKAIPFILLCIALLGKNKQHMLLFNSISMILKKGYDIKLNLVGDGPDKNELIQYAKKLRIDHIITFMGAQSREAVKEEIDRAHIVVSASRFESFGLSIVEAFACGRPVVAIDSGGPGDSINPENGILIQENVPEKLAEGIISVMNNYENYDQEKIKADCLRKYSESAVWELLKPVYEAAIN
ncbi:MAG: glycosyltransferase [Bacteroidota bacterium]